MIDGIPQSITIGKRTFTVLFPDLIRPLTELERQPLKNSIRKLGVRVAIVVDENNGIIDGINRAMLASEVGLVNVPVDIRVGLSHDQKMELAISLNADRRHLTPSERKRVKDERVERVAQARRDGESLRTIAEKENVSLGQVQRDLASTVSSDTVEPKDGTVKGKDGRIRKAKPRMPKALSAPTAPPTASEPPPIDAEKWKQILFLRRKTRAIADIASLLDVDEITVDEICTAAEATGELTIKRYNAHAEKIVEELDAKKTEVDLANGIAPQPQREPSPLEEMRNEALPLIEAIQAELKKPDMERERVRQSAYGIKKALGGWNDRDALLHLKSFWDLADNEEQEAFRRWIETR